MANITLKGNSIHTFSDLPGKGMPAPDFLLTRADLSDFTMHDYAGKTIVLNIFPSLDTAVCAMSVRKFNAAAGKAMNTVVVCVSKDLPFAHGRFCTTEGLSDVVAGSVLRNDDFGKDYGVLITDGPLAGLLSRAVVIIDPNGRVVYTEQVPEIAQEPDYEAALKVLA